MTIEILEEGVCSTVEPNFCGVFCTPIFKLK